MSAFSSISGEDISASALRIDEASASITYIGKAEPGSLASAAVWRIQRITTTGGSMVIEWVSNGSFNQVWDDRASLSYS